MLDKIDEDQLVELTRSLVRAAGQNPPGEEAATVSALARAAAELRFDVREEPARHGRNNLRVTLRTGDGPGLLLLGHTDVVPVGQGWTRDPFGAVVQGGRIYGRGAADMKGGLAACLSAMAALRGRRFERPRRTGRTGGRGGERNRHPRLCLLCADVVSRLHHRGAHRTADHRRRARCLLPKGRCARNRLSRRQSRRRRQCDLRRGRCGRRDRTNARRAGRPSSPSAWARDVERQPDQGRQRRQRGARRLCRGRRSPDPARRVRRRRARRFARADRGA